jgi:hypothetical protein
MKVNIKKEYFAEEVLKVIKESGLKDCLWDFVNPSLIRICILDGLNYDMLSTIPPSYTTGDFIKGYVEGSYNSPNNAYYYVLKEPYLDTHEK